MILLIDIGNTNVVLGIYENDKKINSWRLETRQTKTLDEYGLQLKSLLAHENIHKDQIEDIVIGSVVPNLENTFKNMCKKYFNKEAIVIGENTKTGMPIKYENPKEVGADRIANSVAMAHGYKLPAILIDMGTAITFDVRLFTIFFNIVSTRLFQIFIEITFLPTGSLNVRPIASRPNSPSKPPYFSSPIRGYPAHAIWHRIWCLKPWVIVQIKESSPSLITSVLYTFWLSLGNTGLTLAPFGP